MAPVHVRVRKTQCIQVVLKDLYMYKSQKCDLYAVRIVRYGLTASTCTRIVDKTQWQMTHSHEHEHIAIYPISTALVRTLHTVWYAQYVARYIRTVRMMYDSIFT